MKKVKRFKRVKKGLKEKLRVESGSRRGAKGSEGVKDLWRGGGGLKLSKGK